MSNDYIRFEFTDVGNLSREVWNFWFHRGDLILDAYSVQTRPSTRHKSWQTERSYSRLSLANTSCGAGIRMQEKEVPLTEAIKRHAVTLFTESIKVKMWSEVK
jgi:hypothetical protein